VRPYFTPGLGYTYPPGKAPPTNFPGEIPTLSPYKTFPPGLGPTLSPYRTPGPGYTYPPGKVPRVGISPGYLVGGTFPGGYVYPGPGVKYGVIVGKRPGGNGLNGDKVGSFPGAKVCPRY
jgi:hypothetical protein